MNSSSDYLPVNLITNAAELGGWFCEDIGCETEDGRQVATISDRKLAFTVADSEAVVRRGPKGTLSVVLFRFVDVLSLRTIQSLLEASAGLQPNMVLIYRNENEMDFKMSCPFCGQKLWVRDADQDKRGRCPHCHKGFTLPAQEELVASSLSLHAEVPVRRIVRHDPGSLAAPLRMLVEMAGTSQSHAVSGNTDSRKNETMRVSVEE